MLESKLSGVRERYRCAASEEASDGFALAGHVDHVVILARPRSTSRTEFERLVRSLRQMKIEPAGLALVRDRPGRAGGARLPPPARGEEGELQVRGPGVVSGYASLPEETAAVFTADGFYRTGDIFTRDLDGRFFFVGRRSEMIKVGGLKVFPLEVENCLLAHPHVKEVAVLKGEERLRGEIVRAFVVPAPGETLTAREIREFCRTHLADYKVPREIEIRESLPKTGSGKIDKTALG